MELRARPVQRHQHERGDQHHFEPDVEVEDVAGQEGARDAHQQDVDQRVIAEPFTARIDTGERRPRHRYADDGRHHHQQRAEEIGDQGDAERRRPGADLEDLDARRQRRARESRSAAARISSGPEERHHPQQAARCGSRCSAMAVPSGTRMGSARSIRRAPASPTRRGRVGSDRVDVVRAGGLVDTVRQDQGEGEHAEADDDGREDQRLRHGIRERSAAMLGAVMIGGLARVTPGGRENQDVRPVRQQAETDDQLRQPPPQHQVEARGIQHAGDDGEQQFHLTPRSG